MRHLAVFMALGAPAAGGAFELQMPLACRLGQDCYIQHYLDHDPGTTIRDYLCGTLTYDGHDGTDFGIPTLAEMDRGVPVVAAAAGEVAAIRNDMPDVLVGTPGAPDIAGRECGNGVLVRHDDGWETQYCHLRQGSVSVVPGDVVAAGDKLGLVGLSGMTAFPHLHLSVRKDGVEVDPFAPAGVPACGMPPDEMLWADPPVPSVGGLLHAGFADSVPDYEAIKAGTEFAPPAAQSALVVWGYFYGGRDGDTVEIVIAGPAGEIIRHVEELDGKQDLFFRAAGRRPPPEGWLSGIYGGEIRLERAGRLIDSGRISFAMQDR